MDMLLASSSIGQATVEFKTKRARGACVGRNANAQRQSCALCAHLAEDDIRLIRSCPTENDRVPSTSLFLFFFFTLKVPSVCFGSVLGWAGLGRWRAKDKS